jgi:RNA recognition motif-containing protein
MTKKLYVGNLSYETAEDALWTLFAEYGEVESVNLITDRYSGRSRGFAFVEMATDQVAEAAIAGLNGKMVDNREITVAEARPQSDRSGGRRGGDRRKDSRSRSSW